MKSGYIFNSRYQIICLLGEGGMADVYLANDLILHRKVALKIIRQDLYHNDDAIKRFHREAYATAELIDSNIINIYDFGEEKGFNYLVMEYIDGTDLKKYIKDNFPIPFLDVVNIMLQITSAIQVAHNHKIIHCDLKPQNILIDKFKNIKVTDFSISVLLNNVDLSITQTNTVVGSIHYLSPEQARGCIATQRSDIYSLGIILYEMLVGYPPFQGDSAVSIALKHFKMPIPSVRDFNKDIPQSLENVILKATCKNPSDRYISAFEMNNDLKTVFSSDRLNEKKFKPNHNYDLDKTKVLLKLSDALIDKVDDLDKTLVLDKSNLKNKRENGHFLKFNKYKRYVFYIIFLVIMIFFIFYFVIYNNNLMIKTPNIIGMTIIQIINILKLIYCT